VVLGKAGNIYIHTRKPTLITRITLQDTIQIIIIEMRSRVWKWPLCEEKLLYVGQINVRAPDLSQVFFPYTRRPSTQALLSQPPSSIPLGGIKPRFHPLIIRMSMAAPSVI